MRETTPRLVVIDPRMIVDTPRMLHLSSAIKGVEHAVEGMRRVDVDHSHAILAARGVERFLAVLEKWPRKLETREAIADGHVSTDHLLQLQLAAWQCYFYPASVIYGLSPSHRAHPRRDSFPKWRPCSSRTIPPRSATLARMPARSWMLC